MPAKPECSEAEKDRKYGRFDAWVFIIGGMLLSPWKLVGAFIMWGIGLALMWDARRR